MIRTKKFQSTIGIHEAKSKFSELLDQVEAGRTITITRRPHKVAKLVPMQDPVVDSSVFSRIRDMRERLAVGKGESAKELIEAGRHV